MTFLVHDPSTFAAAAAAGFVEVHRDLVQAVPGGVVRSTRSVDDQVAVVIGGGSGHYPAFAGLVGPGLAHGAVLGNIFASPSSHQVESVARAAHQGRGVLLSYGNYAGDTLQFDAAQARLRDEGLDVRTVRVTDDVYSASADQRERRRGIAGDLTVFKIAGAAAARGDDLDGVEALAIRANDNTRSMGVAFTGCTLPGADKPLFEVPAGKMAIGLGIHGEPGLEEVDIPTAEGLARLMVDKLLTEVPGGGEAAGRRVVVIVNGLGSFKYDELFALYGEIKPQLEAAGLEIADAKVGEFCTSFEMGGASLTLLWLDDELEELWLAPAQSPEYSVGNASSGQVTIDPAALVAAAEQEIGESTGESRAAAAHIAAALQIISATVDANMEELGRIDSIAGDGDHGIGMHNGAAAASAAAQDLVQQGAGAGTLLRLAGQAWSDGAGGTSGALWGLMLATLGEAVGDTDALSGAALRRGVREACDRMMAQGGAKVGDKTMVDAVSPFADAFCADSAIPVAVAWSTAAAAAREGAASTEGMLPGLGRARTHGEKARAVPDPGAVSFSQIVTALETHVRDS